MLHQRQRNAYISQYQSRRRIPRINTQDTRQRSQLPHLRCRASILSHINRFEYKMRIPAAILFMTAALAATPPPPSATPPTHLYACTDASFQGKCRNFDLQVSRCCTLLNLCAPLLTHYRQHAPSLQQQHLVVGPRQGHVLYIV
jgi:hypothetical protein